MSIYSRWVVISAVVFNLLVGGSAQAARDEIASICDSAAVVASRESGVPIDVLRAISLTETGRRSQGEFRPWPWTVNMEGVGKWFDDLTDAQRYVDRHYSSGARSFDVGCFQINYKWHGAAFRSIEDMFDPVTNARYAAAFLSELYEEFGDWSKAAGAYHSRTPKYARRYTARFDRIRSDLPAFPSVGPNPAPARLASETPVQAGGPNTYPLLQSTGTTGLASLVPLQDTGSALFGGERPQMLLVTR